MQARWIRTAALVAGLAVAAGCGKYSISNIRSLKAFQDAQGLTFPLLSDFNKTAIRDYGVFNEDMIGLKGIAKRAVFVLDKEGTVRYREVLEDARNEPDYQKALSAVATAA